MVTPLRLTPGKGANIWAIPIKKSIEPRGFSRPLGPYQSRRVNKAVISKTAAVTSGIHTPPRRRALRDVRDPAASLKNNAKGTNGEVATTTRRPTRTISARRNPGETSCSPKQPTPAPGQSTFGDTDQDRTCRAQVQNHVEEEILLARATPTREPGEEALSQQEMAVARDRQEFRDSLNQAEDQ